MARMSIATIDSPEFLNITPYNPLISQCEIKVMYVGENRNHSYITKEVATQMANTLPGCPIVGYYREDKQDFDDHGDRVVIDSDGVKFETLTKPYGFVAPDAKVWFQKFEDTDDFGNTFEREYLMTTGFLWTGQFPECKNIVESGKPQSMELNEETLDGYWSNNVKTNMDFFIINDAIFSKLCILGDDVEPCFEGASVTAPEVSKNFSKLDDNFKHTLFTMMQELKDALEGGQIMAKKDGQFSKENLDKKEQKHSLENNDSVEGTDSFSKKDEEKEKEASKQKPDDASEEDEDKKKFSKEEEEKDKKDSEDEEDVKSDEEEEDEKKKFSKDKEDEEKEKSSEKEDEEDEDKKKFSKDEKEDEEEDEDKKKEFSKKEEEEEDEEEDKKKFSKDDDEEEEEASKEKEEDEEKEKKYSLLESKYQALQEEYQTLQEKYQVYENKEKDALIASFYMLSDEDKSEVVANKAKYSLEEIESKLSVLCVRKKVNFNLDSDSDQVVTYNINNSVSAPAWVTAVKNTQKSRNI